MYVIYNRRTLCVCVSHRDMLLQVLSRSQLVVCYKAKDFLRTALQFYRQDLNWKQGILHIHTHIETKICCVVLLQNTIVVKIHRKQESKRPQMLLKTLLHQLNYK